MNTLIIYAPHTYELSTFYFRIPQTVDRFQNVEFGIEFFDVNYRNCFCKFWFCLDSQKSFEQDIADPPSDIADVISELKQLGVSKMFGVDYSINKYCFEMMSIILDDPCIFIDTPSNGLVRGNEFVLKIESFRK